MAPNPPKTPFNPDDHTNTPHTHLGRTLPFFSRKKENLIVLPQWLKLSTLRMDCSLDDYVKQNKIGKRGGAAGNAFYNKGQGKKVIIRARSVKSLAKIF